MLSNIYFLFLAFAQIWAQSNDFSLHPHFPPSSKQAPNPSEHTSNYWRENAQKTLLEKITRELNQSKTTFCTNLLANI